MLKPRRLRPVRHRAGESGGDYAGFSADAYYVKVRSAIALSALSAAQVAELPTLGYSPSDFLVGCGFAGCPGDAEITSEVKSVFNQYPALEPPNLVYVQTLDRAVYLTGRVNTETECELAQSLADHVAGVTRVVNSINTGYQGH